MLPPSLEVAQKITEYRGNHDQWDWPGAARVIERDRRRVVEACAKIAAEMAEVEQIYSAGGEHLGQRNPRLVRGDDMAKNIAAAIRQLDVGGGT